MKLLKWLDDYLEEALLLIMLGIMVVVMGIQITARYVFASSLSWSEEITRFLFICSGFLSASYCIKKSLSVKIDQLVNMLPVEVSSQVKLDGTTLVNPSATKTILTGDPKDRGAKPASSDFKVEGNDFSYSMPAYSFTVIRIHQNIEKKK